jgi:hypothetical protein
MEQRKSEIGGICCQGGEKTMQTLEDVFQRMDSTTSELQVQKNLEREQPKSTSEKWKKYVPFFQCEMDKAGLDDMLKCFPVMMAKEKTSEIDGNKGFLIQGGVGCGKTARIRLFSNLFCVQILNAKPLCKALAEDNSTEFFRNMTRTDIFSLDEPPERYFDTIIDDLGTEEREYLTFGNRRDVMDEILSARYLIYEKRKIKTHFTTNLNDKMLYDRYGERIFSRICEMCHFIKMPGGDRRRESK